MASERQKLASERKRNEADKERNEQIFKELTELQKKLCISSDAYLESNSYMKNTTKINEIRSEMSF